LQVARVFVAYQVSQGHTGTQTVDINTYSPSRELRVSMSSQNASSSIRQLEHHMKATSLSNKENNSSKMEVRSTKHHFSVEKMN